MQSLLATLALLKRNNARVALAIGILCALGIVSVAVFAGMYERLYRVNMFAEEQEHPRPFQWYNSGVLLAADPSADASDARQRWLSAIQTDDDVTSEITVKSLFNLGTSLGLGRDASSDLSALLKSRDYFRDALNILGDADDPSAKKLYAATAINHELILLKIARRKSDQERQRKERELNKAPYQLVSELLQSEKELLKLTDELSSTTDDTAARSIRQQLMEKREENREKLRILQEKLGLPQSADPPPSEQDKYFSI